MKLTAITKRWQVQKWRKIGYAIFWLLGRSIISLAYILFAVTGAYILIIKYFANKEFDSTLYTNIGFGFFAVCSNISFSWARSFNANQKKLAEIVGFQGERLFLAAIAFLFASVLKYIYLLRKQIPTTLQHTSLTAIIFEIIYFIFDIAFMYACLMGSAGIYDLLGVLLSRHIVQPDVDFLTSQESKLNTPTEDPAPNNINLQSQAKENE